VELLGLGGNVVGTGVIRVVLSDVLWDKDVVEGRDGRTDGWTDMSDSYRTYSCKNGITCPDSFLHFIPR
jgi:hypothetical protein